MLQPNDQDRPLVGIRVLEAQPDLAEGLDAEQSALARRHVVAVLDTIEQGSWSPSEQYEESPSAVGLLIIDGLLAREIRLAGRSCSELLGPGDLLRPWDYDESGFESVPAATEWTVLERTRVAVLDDRFARVACRWPQLVAGLVSRTLRRSRWLAILLAASNLTRVDDRVLTLLWHLADRWGHVTPDGVVVPVRLTHEMIGKLVGAHRPSVTSALGELQRSGAVTRTERGWLLHGSPPDRHADADGKTNGAKRFAFDVTSLVPALPALVSLLG